MAKIAKKLTDLIGNTPLLQLSNYSANKNLEATLLVKLESFNPAGSVKDRIAIALIEDAEAKGKLKPGVEIIEPTSGNTGIGLAFVAAAKGYKLTLTMGTASEEDFDNLFEDMDLNSTKLGKTPEARNTIIAKVLAHLDKIDFKLESTELDVLGDAYEYLIGQFASGAGKKAGEFYTPQEVSKILAKIVTTGKHKLKSVYDPTCGSGSLLLRVAKEVKEVNNFYGQEMNRTTYNLARMMLLSMILNPQLFCFGIEYVHQLMLGKRQFGFVREVRV